ncbi:MAG: hypothetical protein KDK99_09390 [Verrucomicrobiales bacterium]|nr:hypothetical protein [Verrucomicrobiales bacterium]
MIKVLFILSAVLMGLATFYAYMNGRNLASIREERATNNQTIKVQLGQLQGAVDEITALNSDVKRVSGELDVEMEKLKDQKNKSSRADGEIKRVQEETEANNTKLAALKEELGKLPPDVKPETLVEDLNRIKQKIAELKASSDVKQQEVDTVVKKATGLQTVVDNIDRKIEERKLAFDRNSMEANVVAVNTDWGFVIVNAGKPEGIDPSTKLLVVRGTQTVGKLSILSVDGSRTIANILEDTIPPGLSIAPGDKVILENLYQ